MFIGQKEVKLLEETEEKTPGGVSVIRVVYADDTVEHITQNMRKHVVTEEAVTADALRDLRVHPVVAVMLAALREWGADRR